MILNTISNITVPPLSPINVGLAGHVIHPEVIGLVTVAATITSTIYRFFGSVHLGTTGFVAQAYGRQDSPDINRQLACGITTALLHTIVILLVSPFATLLSGSVTGGATEWLGVEAEQYIQIIFYTTPTVILIYALNGWFIGIQNSRVPITVSMSVLVVDFLVSYTLVVHYQMGAEGFAIGTCVAQYSQTLILLTALLIRYHYLVRHLWFDHFTDTEGCGRYLILGKDLMLRSLPFGSATLFFTYAGIREGTITAGANALLMQFFSILGYFTDGFAYAGGSFSGRFYGAGRVDPLRVVILRLSAIGIVLSLFTTTLFTLCPDGLSRFLSSHDETVAHAKQYYLWITLISLVDFDTFLWDGIYTDTIRSAGLK